MEITVEKHDINNVDEVFYAYIIQHNKEYVCYHIKCHFKLVFTDKQNSANVKSNLFYNNTMISWQKYIEMVIEVFFKKRI